MDGRRGDRRRPSAAPNDFHEPYCIGAPAAADPRDAARSTAPITLSTPAKFLKGVGPVRAEALKRLACIRRASCYFTSRIGTRTPAPSRR
jgi:hypothetical protein